MCHSVSRCVLRFVHTAGARGAASGMKEPLINELTAQSVVDPV